MVLRYLDNGKHLAERSKKLTFADSFHLQPGWKPEHWDDWGCLLVWGEQGFILEQVGAIQDRVTTLHRSDAMSREMRAPSEWCKSSWVKELARKSFQLSPFKGATPSNLNPMYVKRPRWCIWKTSMSAKQRKVSSSALRMQSRNIVWTQTLVAVKFTKGGCWRPVVGEKAVVAGTSLVER